MQGQIRQLASDLLLPTYCVGCRRTFHTWLCDDCAASIRRVQAPVCQRCGAPLSREDALCKECAIHPQPDCLTATRAVAHYAGALGRAIRVLKYGHAPDVAEPLGELLVDHLMAHPIPEPLVVPVPLHPARLHERGFNQSELLARVVSRYMDWDIDPSALRRQRNTRAQASLDASARLENVRDAFDAPLRLDGRGVLVIDDVRTTGATLTECAKALDGAGAGPIWALTLARDL